MSDLGATAVVLPELEAMRGVEQSRFHHRDVYGHTLGGVRALNCHHDSRRMGALGAGRVPRLPVSGAGARACSQSLLRMA